MGDSKYQKKINRHKSMIVSLQKSLLERKRFATNASAFIDKLLLEKKITKEELKLFFPTKNTDPIV